VVTAVLPVHLERLGTIERIKQAKQELVEELPPDGVAVLNADDPRVLDMAGATRARVVRYGVSDQAEVRAENISSEGLHGVQFELLCDRQRQHVRLPLLGTHSVHAALAATAVALTDGLPLTAIAEALANAQPPPGRLQRVEAGQRFDVLVDYAHTMHAFRSVLAELRDRTPPPRRLIAVFGATGDRDRAKRPILARIAREYADFFIITNEDPYSEEPEAIMAEVATGAPRHEEGVRFEREQDRARAIERAIERAREGDTVAILGKGHEQNMVVNGRKESWNDVAVARRALESRL
jgi:UDP-N-acetylmuramoyl-L-alanyl-D-glutamate--2,6-diaminopimelate ligase